MSAVAIAGFPCNCGFADVSPVVQLCPCHRYWRDGKELTSVSAVLKRFIPVDYSAVDPGVLENARERGVEVDQLFCQYLAGKLDAIPAGTRSDSAKLLERLIAWWSKQGYSHAETQVIVADDDFAGTLDIFVDGVIIDLKTVSKFQPTYELQVGAYGELMQRPSFGVSSLGVLVVNAREITYHDVPITAIRDWRLLAETYLMAQRRKLWQEKP
jgi:hypothetical protein